MDRLENQVSDLRFLTQQPVLVDETPILSPRHVRGSPHSAPGDNSALTPTRPTPRSSSGYSPGDAQPPPMQRQGPQKQEQQQQQQQQQQQSSEAPQANLPQSQSTAGARGSVADNSPPASDEPSSSAAKRKADEQAPAGKQQRSKRNRYISIACNECKRRKIKCNGGSPCQRCGNLGVECLYSALCCANNFRESAEYRGLVANIKALEEQMKAMHQALNALQSGGSVAAAAAAAGTSGPSTTISSSLSPASSIPSLHRGAVDHALKPAAPGFRGPTSATFSLDVAKNTLRTMGYDSVGQTSDEAALAGTNDGAGLDDQPPQPPQQSLQQQPGSASASLRLDPHIQLRQVPRDPLWDFDKDEMVRLCRLHEEEVGVMYPVVNIETVIAHAKNLATAMENAAKATRGGTPSVPAQSGWPDPEEMLNDEKTHQLKGVMCCALLVEEHGHSEKAAWLFESVRPVADRRLMSDPADVATLPFLALVAGYHFLSNDEVLAWRVMGQVTRLCLELGLHRRDAIMNIPDAADRENAIITFWSAYVLDRRWSFATGLPYVVQDNEVDPNLPMPDALPFLGAMITYSRVGAKVWRLVSHFEPALARDLRREEIESLDQEIMNWYHSVPEEVQIKNWEKDLRLTSTPDNLQRLQIWTYLRLNQIRIWLFTPVLHSASSIVANFGLAKKAVDLAKDTIQFLARLNNTTNLYRKLQVFYHQFLTSAIAVLFLASCHAPVHFSSSCRGEFYTALELVKDLSHKSYVSKRLWRTIRSLKDFAPRLGLEEDPQSAAAMTMAGAATAGRANPGYQDRRPAAAGGGGRLQQQYHHHHHQTSTPPGPAYAGLHGGHGGPGATQYVTPHGASSSYAPSSATSLASPVIGGFADQQQAAIHEQPFSAALAANNGLLISTEMGRMFDSFTALNGWRPEIQGTIPAPAASSMALNSPSDPASATLTPAEGLRGAGDTTGSVLPPRGIASADELGNPGGAMAGATTGGGLPGAPFVIKSENVYQHFRELF